MNVYIFSVSLCVCVHCYCCCYFFSSFFFFFFLFF